MQVLYSSSLGGLCQEPTMEYGTKSWRLHDLCFPPACCSHTRSRQSLTSSLRSLIRTKKANVLTRGKLVPFVITCFCPPLHYCLLHCSKLGAQCCCLAVDGHVGCHWASPPWCGHHVHTHWWKVSCILPRLFQLIWFMTKVGCNRVPPKERQGVVELFNSDGRNPQVSWTILAVVL